MRDAEPHPSEVPRQHMGLAIKIRSEGQTAPQVSKSMVPLSRATHCGTGFLSHGHIQQMEEAETCGLPLLIPKLTMRRTPETSETETAPTGFSVGSIFTSALVDFWKGCLGNRASGKQLVDLTGTSRNGSQHSENDLSQLCFFELGPVGWLHRFRFDRTPM